MREHILAVVEARGVVQFAFKTKHNQHFIEAKIGKTTVTPETPYFIMGPFWRYYATAKEAVDTFMDVVFTKKNLGLCYEGIVARNLNEGRDFDDMELDEIKALVRRYRNEFWAEDYPFAADK